jgi:hypothetical protein
MKTILMKRGPIVTVVESLPETGDDVGQRVVYGGAVWSWDGLEWNLLSFDVGDDTILIDEYGNILITEDYEILIEG